MLDRRDFARLTLIGVPALLRAGGLAAAEPVFVNEDVQPDRLLVVTKHRCALQVDLRHDLPVTKALQSPPQGEALGDLRLSQGTLVLNIETQQPVRHITLSGRDGRSWQIDMTTRGEDTLAAVSTVGCLPVLGQIYRDGPEDDGRWRAVLG